MYKFIKVKDKTNDHDFTDVQIKVDNADIAWPELMEVFVNFLQACGYVLDTGHYVQDRELDQYIDDRTQQMIRSLMEALVSSGKLNELLVHPDAAIREAAKKAFSTKKDTIL